MTTLITDTEAETVNFTAGMIKFAEQLETDNDDDCILLIAAMIKDSAYEIKKAAEQKTYYGSKT